MGPFTPSRRSAASASLLAAVATLYSELGTGERELYDSRVDAFELRNRAGSASYAALEQRLRARLSELGGCSGVGGRDAPTAAPFCE